ncbi:hypothetical protein DBN05_000627 [Salmonella enterica subsp. enterica serovar Anderlecht]|nr:hypothetical protein [Salmonella enterica subsp. enterica serovar Anderlecht]EEJ3528524.1 hypothetical protein [Salmonella enterica subsp. enterica serovar Anderlecht]
MIRQREIQFYNLPDCSCGGSPVLRGRYATEGKTKIWYYRVYCQRAACGKRITLVGDIWTRQDAIQAWQRRIAK